MGGHAAGEVASAVAISVLTELDEDLPASELLDALADAVTKANQILHQMVAADPSIGGMGTTLTAMLWSGTKVALCHIGDSRAYVLSAGRLVQLTHDHTLVQSLVDDGRISPDEAATHPQRSLLLRALDGSNDAEPDLSVRDAQVGDRYLLCSDGLSGVVSHQTLEETLGSYYSPEQTIAELIELALRGGGPDNITCVVADVLDIGDAGEHEAMAAQYDLAPVVVGAVAEGKALGHHSVADTPAARAASLGRVPGANGAEGYGDGEDGSGGYQEYGEYEGEFDDDFEPEGRRRRRRAKERKRRGWVLPTTLGVALVALLGGGAYFGYQWTQTQYYVGVNGDHLAVYKGVSQNLAGFKLSSVYEDHPDVAMKNLPGFEQKNLQTPVSASSLSDAQGKINVYKHEATVCQEVRTARTAPTPTPTPTPKPSGSAKPGAHPTASPSASPTPQAPTTPPLSSSDQTLAQQCVTP
jgi:protein phosphatase